MKLTKQKLKQIIKEELERVVREGEVVPFVPRQRYDMNDWESFVADMNEIEGRYGFQVDLGKDNNGQKYVSVYTNLIKGEDLMAKMEGEPLPGGSSLPPDMSFDEEQLYVMTDEDVEY
jgi:hypothetical protein|tara:strand:+ start:136 stop:489 length:354 start_codon:yes stop_codon:yes gene_type:complete